MKNIFITSVILSAVLISSCKKEETPGPSAPEDKSGRHLTVKVFDQSGNPSKAKIYIEHIVDPYAYIVDDSVNATGVYETGKLIEGNYFVTVFTSAGKKSYRAEKVVQMVEGVDKTIELFPFSNSGNIKIIATDLNGNILNDVSVALIPHARYGNTYTYSQLIAEAWEVAAVNANGEVTFSDLPMHYEYSVMFFRSALQFDYPTVQSSQYSYWIRVSKGKTTTETIQVNL